MEIISKNWLITGGCGFIGVNLIDYLLRHYPEINIRILDNLSVGSRDDLREVATFSEILSKDIKSGPAGVELVVGDILDYPTCLQAGTGAEVVIHLAANTGVGPSVENPRKDLEVNVLGIFNMLEAARQQHVSNFIFASSGAPVGEVVPPIHEELAPKPVSPYGASKLAGEGYCSAYYRTFGLKTVALRFGNVYGPRSKHKSSVVAKFFNKALAGETLEIYGDGTQTRDFIYIDDLVQAVILAARSGIGGEIFQIATYKESTVNEVAQMIIAIVEKSTGRKIKVIHGEHRLGDVKRNYSDISKAKKVLGFEPKYDLQKGLNKTFRYFYYLPIVVR